MGRRAAVFCGSDEIDYIGRGRAGREVTMNRKFFSGIDQGEARVAGKKIKVPVFYYDASSVTAIFPARMRAVKEALPTADYRPLSIAPGIAVVGVTALTYRKTSIGPYNELAVTIPMLFKKRALPGISLIGQLLRNEFHVYIRHLPVTTQIALDGGVIVYNYPKFLSRIVFAEKADSIVVTLEEKGERILTLRGSKIPAKKSQVMRYVTYPFKDGYAHEAP